MAENPNADYSKLFDDAKKTFPEVYEQAMDQIAERLHMHEGLVAMLKQKRAFGLEKYGERAFQSTFENAISSPVAAHLGDEVIDAFNYAMHGYYIATVRMRQQEAESYLKIIEALNNVVTQIIELTNTMADRTEADVLKWARQ